MKRTEGIVLSEGSDTDLFTFQVTKLHIQYVLMCCLTDPGAPIPKYPRCYGSDRLKTS